MVMALTTAGLLRRASGCNFGMIREFVGGERLVFLEDVAEQFSHLAIGRLCKGVLAESASFHDRSQMPSLMLEQIEIPKRVAVHHQQVRERVGHQFAKLSFLLQDAS